MIPNPDRFRLELLPHVASAAELPQAGAGLVALARLRIERRLFILVLGSTGERLELNEDDPGFPHLLKPAFHSILDKPKPSSEELALTLAAILQACEFPGQVAGMVVSIQDLVDLPVEAPLKPPPEKLVVAFGAGVADMPNVNVPRRARLLSHGKGARAQLELFRLGADKTLSRKYSLPWGTTIRPPVKPVPRVDTDFRSVVELFDAAALSVNQSVAVRLASTRFGARPAVQPRGDADQSPSEQELKLRALGKILWDKMVPKEVKPALILNESFFLELGVHESMIQYPWELMFSDEFVCLKNFVGRYIISEDEDPDLEQVIARSRDLTEIPEDLRVLLIVVSFPGDKHLDLPHARIEKRAICDALCKRKGFKRENLEIIEETAATYNAIMSRCNLEEKRYHIVHFCGHAAFNWDEEANDDRSELMLYDKPIEASVIRDYFAPAKPLLCFINSCDSAFTGVRADPSKPKPFQGRGLVRAFLRTGAYFIGSTSPISDDAAGCFANEFYTSLAVNGNSIGEAICRARNECKQKVPNDYAWASYVFYGDPRLTFPVPEN
jgi:hypothetical protein